MQSMGKMLFWAYGIFFNAIPRVATRKIGVPVCYLVLIVHPFSVLSLSFLV